MGRTGASHEIDVVHNCTPNDLHAPIAAAALRAGKHVICEKPLALSVPEAEPLIALAAESGLTVAVPFVYRYHPLVREAQARVLGGALGRVRLIHGSYLQDWLSSPADNNWRVDVTRGGPSCAFADIGSHWCDLVEFVSGQRLTRLIAQTVIAVPERVDVLRRETLRVSGEDARVRMETEDIATLLFLPTVDGWTPEGCRQSSMDCARSR